MFWSLLAEIILRKLLSCCWYFFTGLTFQTSHPIFWNKQTTPFSKINPKKMASQGSIRFKFKVTAKENRTNLSCTIAEDQRNHVRIHINLCVLKNHTNLLKVCIPKTWIKLIWNFHFSETQKNSILCFNDPWVVLDCNRWIWWI